MFFKNMTFAKMLKSVLFVLMMVVSIMIFVQVVLRYLFHSSLGGIEELLIFPTMWIFFLGGVNASREKSHITVDVLEIYFTNEKSKNLIRVISSFLTVIVSVWVTYWGYDNFIYSLNSWKLTASLHVPIFYAESAIFICLVLMTIYHLIHLFDYISAYLNFNKSGKEVDL